MPLISLKSPAFDRVEARRSPSKAARSLPTRTKDTRTKSATTRRMRAAVTMAMTTARATMTKGMDMDKAGTTPVRQRFRWRRLLRLQVYADQPYSYGYGGYGCGDFYDRTATTMASAATTITARTATTATRSTTTAINTTVNYKLLALRPHAERPNGGGQLGDRAGRLLLRVQGQRHRHGRALRAEEGSVPDRRAGAAGQGRDPSAQVLCAPEHHVTQRLRGGVLWARDLRVLSVVPVHGGVRSSAVVERNSARDDQYCNQVWLVEPWCCVWSVAKRAVGLLLCAQSRRADPGSADSRHVPSDFPGGSGASFEPENVMLSDEGEPLLTDFGSVTTADVTISKRSDALMLQERAAQQSSMAYRAPELYDVPDNAHISSATDVWSLGCLLYAMAFGYSPFECSFYDSGVVRVVECTYLAVIGPIKFPKNCSYSPRFCDMIRWILTQDATARPSVFDVIERLHGFSDTNVLQIMEPAGEPLPAVRRRSSARSASERRKQASASAARRRRERTDQQGTAAASPTAGNIGAPGNDEQGQGQGRRPEAVGQRHGAAPRVHEEVQDAVERPGAARDALQGPLRAAGHPARRQPHGGD
ncbi:hypothetical protein ON010_g16110 [Phytophthora cinnamomi]|nr:hypothetical protein ON010_g16110 [Phytophthora cinnamomi]